jgi:hypothetical protein
MPEKLDFEKCPLLPENSPLVSDFNSLVDELNRVEKELPAAVGHLGKFLIDLNGVRQRLTRTHYKLGLLGTTQDGKSTALNLILGFDAKHPDAPAKSGVGDATTANVSRVRKSVRGDKKLKVRYLDQQQYEAKRKSLSDNMLLNVNNTNEVQLLTELDQLAHKNPLHKSYVKSFLNSYLKNRAFVQSPPKEEDVNYDARVEILNHKQTASDNPDQAGNKNLLIYEVAIEIPTDGINQKCELIDLPGLAAYPWDDWLTDRYLKDVDGVFVFHKSFQTTNEAVSRQVFKLKSLWGDEFKNRAWMIFSRFQGTDAGISIPSDDNYDTKAPNLLKAIHDTLNIFGISPEQTIFMESQWFGNLPSARVGEVMYPNPDMAIFREFPQFRSIFKELLASGGIELLKKIVQNDLPTRVGKSIEILAAKDIHDLRIELNMIEKTTRRRMDASSEDLEKFEKCAQGIRKLLANYSGKPPTVDKVVKEFRTFLTSSLEEHCSKDIVADWTHQELGTRFDRITGIINKKYKVEIDSKLATPVYEEITATLQNTTDFPKVEVLASEDILTAWKNLIRSELDPDSSWKSELPEFNSQAFSRHMNQNNSNSVGFDGKALRMVLVEKTRIASHQAGHIVRLRVKHLLGQIHRELDILSTRSDKPATAAK